MITRITRTIFSILLLAAVLYGADTKGTNCAQAIQLYREGQAGAADTVRNSCSAEVVALVLPASSSEVKSAPATTGAINYSLGPSVMLNDQQLRLEAANTTKIPVVTKANSAQQALQDAAVLLALNKALEVGVMATLPSHTGMLGAVYGIAAAAELWTRRRSVPAYQFTVIPGPAATIQVPAGQTTLVIPTQYGNLRLLKLTRLEHRGGYPGRVIEAQKGKIRRDGDSSFTPHGSVERTEVPVEIVEQNAHGQTVRTQALLPGEDYALYSDRSTIAYAFSVR